MYIIEMDELICVLFKIVIASVCFLRGAALTATSSVPVVFSVLVPDISVSAFKSDNRIQTAWIFRAIKASTGQQACQLRNSDTEYLPFINVLKSFLEVRVYRFESGD